jgi:hypothetical protein
VISRELLVSDVWVVLELARGLDDVDAPAPLTGGKLGAPDRSIESGAEVDVVHDSARLEVRFAARDHQLAHREVRLRAVQIHARLIYLEGDRLTQGRSSGDGSARQRDGQIWAVTVASRVSCR